MIFLNKDSREKVKGWDRTTVPWSGLWNGQYSMIKLDHHHDCVCMCCCPYLSLSVFSDKFRHYHHISFHNYIVHSGCTVDETIMEWYNGEPIGQITASDSTECDLA